MSNPSKIKGSQFERDLAEILNRLIKKSSWRRIAGSGAIGTIMNEPLLSSDVRGKVESFAQPFNVECKVGYNNSTGKEVKQFTLKKEWLDKVALEASRTYGIPILAGKFLGAREGTKVFITMDVEVFASLINRITELHEDLLKSDILKIKMEDVK
jgi:Holliday junction resolvase